ncbi:transmembrane protein 136-like [Chenopodium quinoa]|uniref:transmembrane protein 136-like n=1 Tax=Chenopodium quinoa TaxID=63459 RepID=UPI000B788F21|nr:transmembrane protein 136-like [Chenopodium quinoa]
MEDGMVNTTLLAVISWSTYFMLTKKLLPNYSYEFRNRIVSTTHAILAVTLASHSVKDWSCPVCPSNTNSNPQQMQALAVTMGYLIYDLVCSQFDKKSNLDNTIHHLVSIIGIVAGISYQKCVSEMIAALFITEISSPFLHLREFLKELGYRDTDLNLAADIMFAVTFSIARMVLGPFLFFAVLSADNPLLIKAMAAGLQFVSAYWFYKILKMVQFKLTKRTRSKKVA